MYGVGRFVVGILANILAVLLRLSPAPTFWKIYKDKSTTGFHPYPYLAGVMNCLLWILYRMPPVYPDVLLLIISAVGLTIMIIYVGLFLWYTTKRNRVIIVLSLLGEAALLAIIVLVTLFCFHARSSRSTFVGISCAVFNIISFASPLSIIRQVLKTQSIEFLPFWICTFGFADALVSFIYSFIDHIDLYHAIANGAGTLLSLLQLGVYAHYTYKAKRSGAEGTNTA